MENKLFTIKQAASYLGVTEIHLRGLIADKVLPFVNVARGKVRPSIRIQWQILQEFVNSGGVKQ